MCVHTLDEIIMQLPISDMHQLIQCDFNTILFNPPVDQINQSIDQSTNQSIERDSRNTITYYTVSQKKFPPLKSP